MFDNRSAAVFPVKSGPVFPCVEHVRIELRNRPSIEWNDNGQDRDVDVLEGSLIYD